MLPEFETAIAGLKSGDTTAFSLTFPADYHGKEVAGKAAQFDLTVKEVSRPAVPPLDSAFATAFGIKSGKVEDLRAEVDANLRLELKRKLESVLKEQAMKGLREKAQLTLPKSLIDIETRELMRRMAANLQQQGMKPEDIKLNPDMFRPQAEERVALGLVLSELVRTEHLEARPEQVKAMVQEIGADLRAAGGRRPLALRETGAPCRFRSARRRAQRRRLGAGQGAGQGGADVLRGLDGAWENLGSDPK